MIIFTIKALLDRFWSPPWLILGCSGPQNEDPNLQQLRFKSCSNFAQNLILKNWCQNGYFPEPSFLGPRGAPKKKRYRKRPRRFLGECPRSHCLIQIAFVSQLRTDRGPQELQGSIFNTFQINFESFSKVCFPSFIDMLQSCSTSLHSPYFEFELTIQTCTLHLFGSSLSSLSIHHSALC